MSRRLPASREVGFEGGALLWRQRHLEAHVRVLHRAADADRCAAGAACVNGACVADSPCNGLTYEGCCDGLVLTWCENNEIVTIDCSQNPGCGWSESSAFYDCAQSGSGPPEFPIDCPF